MEQINLIPKNTEEYIIIDDKKEVAIAIDIITKFMSKHNFTTNGSIESSYNNLLMLVALQDDLIASPTVENIGNRIESLIKSQLLNIITDAKIKLPKKKV